MFTVETVSCLGACGLAPVLTVNDVVHPEMNPDKAAALLIDDFRSGKLGRITLETPKED